MLSVCIPFYAKPATIVKQAIESAARALPAGSELLILPNGADSSASLREIALPGEARVVESETVLSMVSNWNRCLDHSTGDLVHILHDDDVVAPGFYTAILDLHREFPDAALYSTGVVALETKEDEGAERTDASTILFRGDDAARFILEDERYFPGTIVMSRRAIRARGPFREEFPHSLDDEAFPRYASDGGIAFDPAPLYRLRTHELQTRHGVWHREDFVSSYLESRVEAATWFSPSVTEFAVKSAARRIISVAVTLALNGDEDVANRHLDDLRRIVPACGRWPRFWLARTAARSRIARKAAALRRHARARRPGSKPSPRTS